MTAIKKYNISGKFIHCHFDEAFESFMQGIHHKKKVLLIDENVLKICNAESWNIPYIAVPSGENNKTQFTADQIISQLIQLQFNKDDMLVGIGGGVVTDITGYVASIYKRGVSFGLVPTTVLAMVDAAIGGKNGVNVGFYKNMVGTVHQPDFILYDYSFLKSLDEKEWSNGFAEIIKHACILDEQLFQLLSSHDLKNFQKDPQMLHSLVVKNADIKFNIVQSDPLEKGSRMLLNFGHSFGHAFENLLAVSHGDSVSAGMVIAARVSCRFSGLPVEAVDQLAALLKKYGLPVSLEADTDQLFELLLADKKRSGDDIHFILLENIGTSQIRRIPVADLKDAFKEISS